MPINLLVPFQVKKQLAAQAKHRRLEKNLSRKSLADKSGVPESTIKRFETTGNVSISALLSLAHVLDCLGQFTDLFIKAPEALYLPHKERTRGRR